MHGGKAINQPCNARSVAPQNLDASAHFTLVIVGLKHVGNRLGAHARAAGDEFNVHIGHQAR